MHEAPILGTMHRQLCDETGKSPDRRHVGNAAGLRPVIEPGIAYADKKVSPTRLSATPRDVKSPESARFSDVGAGDCCDHLQCRSDKFRTTRARHIL